jgi:hypothetical protein
MLRTLTSLTLISALLVSTTSAAAAPPKLERPELPAAVRPEQREPAVAVALGLVVGFGVGQAYGGVYGDYGFVFTIVDALLVGGLVGSLGLMLQRDVLVGTVVSEDQGGSYYIIGALGALISGGALGLSRIVQATTAGVSAHRMNQSQLRITPILEPGGARGLGLSFSF